MYKVTMTNTTYLVGTNLTMDYNSTALLWHSNVTVPDGDITHRLPYHPALGNGSFPAASNHSGSNASSFTPSKDHNRTSGLPVTYLSEDGADQSTPPRLHGAVKLTNERLPRLSRGHTAAAVVASVCIFVVLVMVGVYCRKPYNYQHIQSDQLDSKYDYIYRPLAGGDLDEEYDNTFVGVSIPLLQDNTKV